MNNETGHHDGGGRKKASDGKDKGHGHGHGHSHHSHSDKKR